MKVVQLIKSSQIKSLCFIPARGGSTRLPKKNIKSIGGKALISHTIEAAIKSDCFTDIVVSTDDKAIKKVAQTFKEIAIDKRPDYLATNTATALNTLLEYLKRSNEKIDIVTLMLPTCPFRNYKHVREGFALLNKHIDSVISVTPYSFPYEMSMVFKNGSNKLQTFFDPSPLITGNTRSQDQRQYYHPNGGVYISWVSSLYKHGNFFAGHVSGYIMDHAHSHDIDTHLDYKIAKCIWENLLSTS